MKEEKGAGHPVFNRKVIKYVFWNSKPYLKTSEFLKIEGQFLEKLDRCWKTLLCQKTYFTSTLPHILP